MSSQGEWFYFVRWSSLANKLLIEFDCSYNYRCSVSRLSPLLFNIKKSALKLNFSCSFKYPLLIVIIVGYQIASKMIVNNFVIWVLFLNNGNIGTGQKKRKWSSSLLGPEGECRNTPNKKLAIGVMPAGSLTKPTGNNTTKNTLALICWLPNWDTMVCHFYLYKEIATLNCYIVE